MEHIFNKEQLDKAEFILENPVSKLSDLFSNEIKDLACVWCYYSGKIEGNTYTYVETESLLKDGITSPKRYEDAKMLKNLYNTFISEVEYIKGTGNIENIDERTLLRIHGSLITGLISGEDVTNFRSKPVAIRGTNYLPPKTRTEILSKVNEVLYKQDLFLNPLEKAVFLHCNLAKIQPFIDGNKRTARMIESIVLMNNDIIPVYSSKDEDIINYRKGLIEFYETDNYSKYVDYFLNRQIERINEIAPAKFQYNNGGSCLGR